MTILTLSHVFINMVQTIGTYFQIVELTEMTVGKKTVIIRHHFGSGITLKSITRYTYQVPPQGEPEYKFKIYSCGNK